MPRWRRWLGLGLGLALACSSDAPTTPSYSSASPSAAVAAAAGSWNARADYPTDLYYAASASITDPATHRNTLYVIGGHPRYWDGGVGNITSAVKAYDLTTNTWAARAPIPVRVRASNGAVVINGKIYLSGGISRLWDAQRSVWRLSTLRSLYVYDPTTNTWARKADMPIASAALGVSASYQGALYVATSCSDTAVCGEDITRGALWRYTPGNDKWVLLSRTPHDPWSGGGGFVGGKFYLVEPNALDVYDVATNTWSTGPQPPFSCAPASTTLRAKLYLVGCRADDDLSGVWPMLVFDPKTGSWSQAAAPRMVADGHPLAGGNLWTLSWVVVNGAPALELIGGSKPGNNGQYIP